MSERERESVNVEGEDKRQKKTRRKAIYALDVDQPVLQHGDWLLDLQ